MSDMSSRQRLRALLDRWWNGTPPPDCANCGHSQADHYPGCINVGPRPAIVAAVIAALQIEESSLGTPGAKALRDRVSDEDVRRIRDRARELRPDVWG